MPPKSIIILSENEVLQLLRYAVKCAGGQSAWAREQGISRSHLNKILQGRKPISPTILTKLKIKQAYIREV
jgi:DNA-binding phage protein